MLTPPTAREKDTVGSIMTLLSVLAEVEYSLIRKVDRNQCRCRAVMPEFPVSIIAMAVRWVSKCMP